MEPIHKGHNIQRQQGSKRNSFSNFPRHDGTVVRLLWLQDNTCICCLDSETFQKNLQYTSFDIMMIKVSNLKPEIEAISETNLLVDASVLVLKNKNCVLNFIY